MKEFEKIIPVESIQERDVDMLILEEFNVNDDFLKWFISQLVLPENSQFIGAKRSITDFGLGETDLLLGYKSKDKDIYVLIENKLDTSFQENQYERYVERSEKYIKLKVCHESYCVLIAPKFYCQNQNEFELFITYEDIANKFESYKNKRGDFKARLLKIACEKQRRGYQRVNSIPVQDFWHKYYANKEIVLPELKMHKPTTVPHGSDWPEMRDPNYKHISFYHKLAQGNVDLTFSSVLKYLKEEVQNSLPEGAKFEGHKRRFSVRIFTGVIDRTKDFNEQKEMVDKGLEAISMLHKWLVSMNFKMPS